MKSMHVSLSNNYGNIVRHEQLRSNMIVKSYIASRRSRILGGIPAKYRDKKRRRLYKSTITGYSTKTERAVTRTLTVQTKTKRTMVSKLTSSSKTGVVMG